MLNADTIINKTILVGISIFDKEEILVENRQFFGTIVSYSENRGIEVKTDEGDIQFLPPDISALSIAEPGEYSLKSMDKVVSNLDLIATYNIYEA